LSLAEKSGVTLHRYSDSSGAPVTFINRLLTPAGRYPVDTEPLREPARIMIFASLLPLLPLLTTALASPSSSNDGTFEVPSASTRVRFRYWLPDASVDPQVIANDIQAAGSLGAGGVEFLPFYNYGGEQGAMPEGADWARYGFGMPAVRNNVAWRT
jgi:hypothetical protein